MHPEKIKHFKLNIDVEIAAIAAAAASASAAAVAEVVVVVVVYWRWCGAVYDRALVLFETEMLKKSGLYIKDLNVNGSCPVKIRVQWRDKNLNAQYENGTVSCTLPYIHN